MAFTTSSRVTTYHLFQRNLTANTTTPEAILDVAFWFDTAYGIKVAPSVLVVTLFLLRHLGP